MSHQLTFADSEFSTKRRQTRKEIFLSRMEQILPWQNMTAVIEPFYPKAGNGRRPYPLETMLRIHCMQHWYNLSDGAMEDALYEIASMRLFARLSLDSALPDRTTIMNFRHLLEQHQLARQLFKTINRWLAEAGVMMTQGTLVDATIIEAPSSTKNKEQQRDPEMHQTKKGNQWHFGMKAHIGVDAKSGLTHSLVTTAANEHDLNQLGNLLHGEEQFVSADAGYQGAPQREELAEVDVDWLIAERPGKVRTLKQHPRKNKRPSRGQFGDRKFLYYKDFPGMSKPVFMVSVCSSVKIKGRDCGTINGHDESSSIRALMKDAREVLEWKGLPLIMRLINSCAIMGYTSSRRNSL